MVRIKERYLLVNVLYPTSVLPKQATQGTQIPDFVALHQPTSDQLTPQSLLKGIRQEVSALFGDYGFGATEGNLSGEMPPSSSDGHRLGQRVLTYLMTL